MQNFVRLCKSEISTKIVGRLLTIWLFTRRREKVEELKLRFTMLVVRAGIESVISDMKSGLPTPRPHCLQVTFKCINN